MFKSMRVDIYLKSGARLRFKCDKFSWTRTANELTGYTIAGGDWVSPDYINIDQIDAIVCTPHLILRMMSYPMALLRSLGHLLP